MSDVIKLRPNKPASSVRSAKTLKSEFGEDEWLLKLCAQWRAARAQQQKNWAEHELATGWGYLPDEGIELDLDPLKRMQELEFHLSTATPGTMLLARELLGICVTILAHQHEDPESTLAQGPVLEILRNVISSLENLKGDMSIELRKRRHKGI